MYCDLQSAGAESKVGSLLCLSHDSFDQAPTCVAAVSFILYNVRTYKRTGAVYFARSSRFDLQSPFTHPSPCSSQRTFLSPGQLINSNTLEAFKKLPRNTLFEKAAEQIVADIESGAALSDPSLLTRFILTCHADLKVHARTPYTCA